MNINNFKCGQKVWVVQTPPREDAYVVEREIKKTGRKYVYLKDNTKFYLEKNRMISDDSSCLDMELELFLTEKEANGNAYKKNVIAEINDKMRGNILKTLSVEDIRILAKVFKIKK